jgi:hypothetical protein
MKLILKSFGALLVLLLVTSGCGANKDTASNTKNTSSTSMSKKESSDSKQQTTETSVHKNEQTENISKDDELFKEAFGKSGEKFMFSSGAGAWRTYLTINSDGSFSGEYTDSDMGGADGPLLSRSKFTGQFGKVTKISDQDYSFEILSIDYAPSGQKSVENIDGTETNVTTSTPYGIDGGKTFHVYKKGRTMSDFSQEVLKWISLPNDEKATTNGVLPFDVVVNVDKEEAFCANI